MGKILVIVESPTKARTIEKFLGKDFEVTSSYGHIRDLPNSAAEIPEAIKKEKWTRLGINIEKDFEPLYIIPDKKKKHVRELKKLVKEADEILLATDEDREGESISWHLLEVLKPKVPVRRLVFHEITKEAIKHSLESSREVNDDLVKAQETRRLIDRLFGYLVSPILWKKMKPKLSAGRVQSVAMRLLVERERERIAFRSADYWDLKANFAKLEGGQSFEADLTHVGDKKVAQGKDFEPTTGQLLKPDSVVHLDEAGAKALYESIKDKAAEVAQVESKPFTSKPSPPFTTSTLQQEASRKLSFTARHTMSVAQRLYENGLITYMRTDSTSLSEEALNGARGLIEREYGKEYLYKEPRIYKTKVKNAQEAHEAIRPAGVEFASIDFVKDKFGLEVGKLYEMIWKRTVASQMSDASGTRVVVQVQCGDGRFRAAGKTIEFPGYLRAYVEGSDDPDAELADQEKILPPLTEKEALDVKEMEMLSHTTKPPNRFTEGSLIRELERLGIGRPSTWATIVDVVLARKYAFKKGTALVPSFLAMALTRLMEDHFTNLVDYSFTASLEDDLDAIARGEADGLGYLNKFYHGNGHPGLKGLVESGEENIDPRIVCGLPIATTDDGVEIEVRIGRYGPFLSNGETRAGLPEFLPPDEVDLAKALEMIEEAERGPQALGAHPETGQPVYVKVGRYGPYVQLGDQEEGGEKPKMSSLLSGMLPQDVDLETACKLLELPKNLGKFPDNDEDILAANGRYGPYVKAGDETRSIPEDEMSPITITLQQAITLLREPKKRGRRKAKALKELGKHPVSEKELKIKDGRFGPYVTDGTLNASIPQGMDVQGVTLEDAVNLLEMRAAKLADQELEAEMEGDDGSKKKTKAKSKGKAKPKGKAKSKKKK